MAVIKFTVIAIAIFIINVKFSNSYDLKCLFLIHDDGYNCHATGTFSNESEVTAIKGQHIPSMNDLDVAVLFIESSSLTQYLPRNTCSKFSNLIEYECFGRNVIEISRENFDNCGNLNLLMINYAKFKTIPFDVFYGAPNVTTIQIAFTSLEILPSGLFDNNPKLTRVDLKNNHLTRIDAMFPSSIVVLNLFGNVCIDRNFSSPNDIIYEKCANQSATESIKNLQFSLNVTKYEVDNLREMIDRINLTHANEFTKINEKINDFTTQFNESIMKTINIENNLKQHQELNEIFEINVQKISEEISKVKMEINDNKKSQNESIRNASDKYVKQEFNFQANFESRLEKNEVVQFVLMFFVSLILVLMIIMMVIFKNRKTPDSDSLLLNEYNENHV